MTEEEYVSTDEHLFRFTEKSWFSCTDRSEMIAVTLPRVTQRKLRLLGCACVGLYWTWGLEGEIPKAVRVAEAYADGDAIIDDMQGAAAELRASRLQCEELYRPYPRTCELTESLLLPEIDRVFFGEMNGFEADMHIVDEPELAIHATYIRDIFGNPFRPVAFVPEWRTEAAVGIAAQMYDSRDFGNMPILADALQDAGCDLPEVLDHCRVPATHVRGCWVVDLLLGKS